MGETKLKLLTGTGAIAHVKALEYDLCKLLDRCHVRKDFPFQWILREVREKRMQVRVTPDTTLLTTIELTPGRRVFVIFAAISKDFDMAIMESIYELARQSGCGIVRFFGRKGWFKRFPNADHSAMISIEV